MGFREMNGVSGHDSVLQGYTGQGTTWAYAMNFGTNHAPSAGSIAGPVDLQSSALPLCYDCPHVIKEKTISICHSFCPFTFLSP